MIGFGEMASEHTQKPSARTEIASVSNVSPSELNQMVARAQAERSAYFAEWLKRKVRVWASIVPGRRSILPRGFSRWQTLPR